MRFFAWYMLLVMLWHTFYRVGIVVYWHYNQDFIAANLCEKRNTLESECCAGKCVLKKQLDETDTDNNLPASRLRVIFEYDCPFTIPEIVYIDSKNVFATQQAHQQPFRYEVVAGRVYSGSTFHPPDGALA